MFNSRRRLRRLVGGAGIFALGTLGLGSFGLGGLGMLGCERPAVEMGDLSLDLSVGQVKVTPGQSTTVSVRLRSTGGLMAPVSLYLRTAEGAMLPDGLSYAFEPEALTLQPGVEASSKLRIAALPKVTASGFDLRIFARSGELEQSADLSLSLTGVQPTWLRQVGSAGTEQLATMVLDSQGNILVGGNTTGAFGGVPNAGDYDGYVLKYHPDGGLEWLAQPVTGSSDVVTGIAVDRDDSVIVAGYTYGTFPGQVRSGTADGFVAKYGKNGGLAWLRQIGTTEIDQITGVAVDPGGAVYAVGSTEGTLPGQKNLGGADLFVIKLAADGAPVWTAQLGSDQTERSGGIGVGADGSIYLSGTSTGQLSGAVNQGLSDAVLVKLKPDGKVDWQRQLGTGGDDVLSTLNVDLKDEKGGIYAVGSTKGVFPGQIQSGGQDALFVKYNADGTRAALKQFGTSYSDFLNGMAFIDGQIYTIGSTRGAFPGQSQLGNQDAFFARHGTDGSVQWLRQFGTNQSDTGMALAGAQGVIYIGGVTFGAFEGGTSQGDSDGFVMQYRVSN